MTVLHVATNNAGKLREFVALLEPLGFTVEGPGADFDVEEDGDTFVANAIKKAQALLRQSGHAAVADDSGLEVEALQGAPGVYSARYAGTGNADQDAANRHKLLAALRHLPVAQRTARFVCVIAYCAPNRSPLLFHGTIGGHISDAEAGDGGFGYDSIFIPSGETATFAQLPASRKNAISHRGQALRALAAYLKNVAQEGELTHLP